jgi:hypothetical protein
VQKKKKKKPPIKKKKKKTQMGRTSGAARIRVQVKLVLSPIVQAMNDKTLQIPSLALFLKVSARPQQRK